LVYDCSTHRGDPSFAFEEYIKSVVFSCYPVRPKAWALSCPTRVKYLIIAAFLAGANPKQTDSLKLRGDKVERRKKQRVGTDNDPDFNTGKLLFLHVYLCIARHQ
jgi:hypothetical protein